MNPTAHQSNQTDSYVFDATQGNFETDVLQKSMSTPVLVDLWAEWCGPCKSLGPVLEKLTGEYNGAFVLAKVDVDKEQTLAAAFGVRSIPMVVLIKNGQPADAFTGALPEGEIRAFLDKHVERPGVIGGDGNASAAAAPVESPAEAAARIREEMADSPEDQEKVFDLIQALLRTGDVEAAQAELGQLPVNLQTDNRAKRLEDQIDLARSLGDAPPAAELQARLEANADDHEARDLLGVRQLMEGDSEAALETFLELLRHDRSWNDGQARKRLVAAFDMIDDTALVARYRRQMSSLLF